ncbi:polysaccharide lyase family 8-like protein [Streptomyces brevispora]|uniref:Polysaccharide lyase family 8-like protein n=1 Tax=Streptomyces brevispora TaxID=887462 RepID=A0A561V2Q5_9ACTN|nr:polysaccharide lyase beta-sandwich domain-containing protein [Streptomyces brevispora]TWG05892.1 polysaccharide lyase family 8-like protein [Streptomyces brevispora]
MLANTAAVQAVAVRPPGLTAADFWQPGQAGRLASTGPASVLVREVRGATTIRISGPDRSGNPFEVVWDRPVEVVWDRPVRGAVPVDPGIEVRATGRRLVLGVDPGTAGPR